MSFLKWMSFNISFSQHKEISPPNISFFINVTRNTEHFNAVAALLWQHT